jgi:hypothetical protein
MANKEVSTQSSDSKQKSNSFLKKVGKRLHNDSKLLIFLICLITIIFSSLLASLVQNNWFQVEVSSSKLSTVENQYVAYDLFKPRNASADNKLPLVIIIPGFQRSRETQTHVAIELARRGYVVINIDPYSQGDSSSSTGSKGSAIASVEGYGAFDMVDYVYDNDDVMPYVDKTRIGITGHSAGGNAAYQASIYFGKRAVDNNGISKVHSVYITGYLISIDSNISYSKSNMGLDFALWDEGAFRNKINTLAPEGTSSSDMHWSVEAHDFVNSGLAQQGLSPIGLGTPLDLGYLYGNPNLRNLRVVNNTPTIHAFQPYNTKANEALITFFETSFNYFNDNISPSSNIWIVKEVFTTLSLIASFVMIIPATSLLLRIPFFKKVKQEPIINTKRRSKHEVITYIISFLICCAFSTLMYLPASKLTLTLFPDASNSVNTWFFPQRMTNAVAVWAFLTGAFSLVIFTIFHFINHSISKYGLKEDIELKKSFDDWGLKIKLKNLAKSILIALIIAVGYFLLLNLVYLIFHVDYRLLFLVAVRKINVKVIIQLLMYAPIFFIFYFSNAIRVNASNMRGSLREWVKMLLAGLINITPLIILLLIQYIGFSKNGSVPFSELPDGTTQWLYINILFTLIPVMFIVPIFNRLFYKLIGNNYVGPIVITIIFIIMSLNNSVAYIPV